MNYQEQPHMLLLHAIATEKICSELKKRRFTKVLCYNSEFVISMISNVILQIMKTNNKVHCYKFLFLFSPQMTTLLQYQYQKLLWNHFLFGLLPKQFFHVTFGFEEKCKKNLQKKYDFLIVTNITNTAIEELQYLVSSSGYFISIRNYKIPNMPSSSFYYIHHLTEEDETAGFGGHSYQNYMVEHEASNAYGTATPERKNYLECILNSSSYLVGTMEKEIYMKKMEKMKIPFFQKLFHSFASSDSNSVAALCITRYYSIATTTTAATTAAFANHFVWHDDSHFFHWLTHDGHSLFHFKELIVYVSPAVIGTIEELKNKFLYHFLLERKAYLLFHSSQKEEKEQMTMNIHFRVVYYNDPVEVIIPSPSTTAATATTKVNYNKVNRVMTTADSSFLNVLSPQLSKMLLSQIIRTAAAT
jgi:hypothetical protein